MALDCASESGLFHFLCRFRLQCPVPTASFQKVLMLDKEPSSWYATDLLLQLFGMNQS